MSGAFISVATIDRDLTLFVPALNESRRIEATLASLLALVAEIGGVNTQILVVDDGSTDDTAEIVQRITRSNPTVELVRHPKNLGLGSGLKTALSHARGKQFLIVPGDNDIPASTLKALISRANAADMVMCYFPDRALRGPLRRVLSAAFGLLYRLTFGIHVEYINGPSIYDVARLRALKLESTRFSIVAEINVKMLRQGATYLEIPGQRQVGLEGSRSFSLKNLAETARVFLRLAWEVHFRNPSLYAKKPRRVREAA